MKLGCLFLLSAVLFSSAVFAQQPEVVKPDYLLPDLRPNLTTFNHRLFSFRVNFAILYDYTDFDQDQTSLAQVGEQKSQEDLRGGRLVLSGQLKFSKPWTYFFGYDYNEHRQPEDRVFEGLDAYLTIPLWADSKVSIGKQKEPFIYEMVGDAANLPQQERILSPFFISRNTGVKFSGTGAGKKMTWSAGWFRDWRNEDISFDETGNEFVGRVTGIPLITDDGSEYLHLGFSARHLGATQGKLRFRGRPESSVADNFINTGDIPADSASEIAFEGLYNHGSFSVLTEVVPGLWVDAPEFGDPHFYGYTFVGSWVFTGENRPYDRNVGYSRRILPRRRIGAWEGVIRYSYVDLTDEAIEGGTLSKWYFGLNWWASRQWKFGIGYGIADLNKTGTEGRTNILLLRAQWIY